MMDRNVAIPIREGILVKKREPKRKWKSRWFVLREDHLAYYKQKDMSSQIGAIKLTGSSVIFPVPTPKYQKRKGVFKLTTKGGVEHLLQAPSHNDAELWVHAISAVTRALDALPQRSSVMTKALPPAINLSDLLGAMQDADAGVRMTTCTVDDVQFNDCFSGKDFVDWLLHWSFASDRDSGADLSRALLQLAHIQPVHNLGKKRSDIVPEASKENFLDENGVFYRFTTLNRSNSCSNLFESSSGSSGSSEGEESEGDILDEGRMGSGKIVKEGFLMKRCHLRKKWKVRKVVLRTGPASLEYYSAAKNVKDPLKVLSLAGTSVVAPSQSNNHELLSVAKKKKHLLCVCRPDVKPMMFQAEDEYSMHDWFQALSKVCPPVDATKEENLQ